MRENQQLVTMIHHAIKDEKMAADFYAQLEMIAPLECKEHIHHIKEDEEKHHKMLLRAYQALCGTMPDEEAHPGVPAPINFLLGMHKAFMDEMHAIHEYQTMYLMACNPRLRDVLFEILTDEMTHAMMLNHCCCMMMALASTPPPPMPPMPMPPFPYPPKG